MMEQRKTEALPHWDMTPVYPGLEDVKFEAALASFRSKIESLEAFLEENGIHEGGRYPSDLKALAGVVRGFIERMNDCAILGETITAYLYSFISTDSFNQTAKKKFSEHEIVAVRLKRAHIYFQSWLRSAVEDEKDVEALFQADPELEAHRFFLEDARRQAQYRMSQAEETLASELSLSGGNAWEKLHGTVTSQLSVPFERDGKLEDVPMPALQNIRRYDPDERVRRAAFEAEIEAWESARESLAACMNGVKGEVNTLDKRRGR